MIKRRMDPDEKTYNNLINAVAQVSDMIKSCQGALIPEASLIGTLA